MTETPDVHVDWHMTPAEWEELRTVLLRNTGYEYIGRLEASGALGERLAKSEPQPATGDVDLLKSVADALRSLHFDDADPIAECHVKGRKQGRGSVAEPQSAPEPPSLEATIAAVEPDTAIGGLLSHVAGTDECAPRPARELAAAMAESAEIRKVVRELIGMFRGISGGWGARTSIGRLNRLAREAGVEPPQPGDPLSAVVAAEHDQLDQLREQLAARTTLLTTVLGEFKLGSDGCHARMSQVTLAKRKLAAGMEITDDERRMIGA